MSSIVPEKIIIKTTAIKLLEKAGRHPALTPRILRQKIESKLELAKGNISIHIL
jgi:hypothetical protein